MDWSDLKDIIGKGAPVLGTLLGGPAGGAVGALISSVLGTDNKPEAVEEALKADPNLIYKLKQAEEDNKFELSKLLIESETKQLSEINTTIRAELATGDKFKSYWRPLFGYIMATTWGAIMLSITYQILFNIAAVSGVITALSGLTGLWGIGLAVLGINVYKRSDDKLAMLGKESNGILSAISSRIKNGK